MAIFPYTVQYIIVAYLFYTEFSLVAQLCPTLYNPMDCSMPGLLVLHHLLELAQVHIYCIGEVI